MSEVKHIPAQKIQCACGRSPVGHCVGLHALSNEQYQKYLEEQQKSLNEQVTPQFLVDQRTNIMKIEVNGQTVDVHVDEEVRKGLTELGIDVDKEIQQGIEQGLTGQVKNQK